MISILISGGMDSFVMAKLIAEQYCNNADHSNLLGVFIDWGQPCVKQERACARICCDYLDIEFVEYKADISAKEMSIGARRPGPRVVPGRNEAFIKTAMGMDTHSVVIGCIKDDHKHYIDCRREHLNQLESKLDINIWTPLIDMTKKDIVKAGRQLPLHLTWSCYQTSTVDPCGHCSSCGERSSAVLQGKYKWP